MFRSDKKVEKKLQGKKNFKKVPSVLHKVSNNYGTPYNHEIFDILKLCNFSFLEFLKIKFHRLIKFNLWIFNFLD